MKKWKPSSLVTPIEPCGVRYTPAALAHLTEIGDYIAKDNGEAAKRVIQAIRSTVEQLRENPNMGRRGHLEGTARLSFLGSTITRLIV